MTVSKVRQVAKLTRLASHIVTHPLQSIQDVSSLNQQIGQEPLPRWGFLLRLHLPCVYAVLYCHTLLKAQTVISAGNIIVLVAGPVSLFA